MNERILSPQLLKLVQAAGSGYSQADPEWIKKFAELIVRECANRATWAQDTGAPDIGAEVLQHFGVEESKGWACSKCGVDRTLVACPLGHSASLTGWCPMTVEAQ